MKLKQFLPRKYVSMYKTDQGAFIAKWYMWLGRVFFHKIQKAC